MDPAGSSWSCWAAPAACRCCGRRPAIGHRRGGPTHLVDRLAGGRGLLDPGRTAGLPNPRPARPVPGGAVSAAPQSPGGSSLAACPPRQAMQVQVRGAWGGGSGAAVAAASLSRAQGSSRGQWVGLVARAWDGSSQRACQPGQIRSAGSARIPEVGTVRPRPTPSPPVSAAADPSADAPSRRRRPSGGAGPPQGKRTAQGAGTRLGTAGLALVGDRPRLTSLTYAPDRADPALSPPTPHPKSPA